MHPRLAKRSHVNGSVYDELYDWKRERQGRLTMCGSEKENVKWTLLTVTMPLKLPEDKEVLWWCCWRASERIERVARGQEHHCILRFTLCHQSPTPSPLSSSPPTPLLRYFPLPLLVEAPHIIYHSRTPIFRYRVPSPLAPVHGVFTRELVAIVH